MNTKIEDQNNSEEDKAWAKKSTFPFPAVFLTGDEPTELRGGYTMRMPPPRVTLRAGLEHLRTCRETPELTT